MYGQMARTGAQTALDKCGQTNCWMRQFQLKAALNRNVRFGASVLIENGAQSPFMCHNVRAESHACTSPMF